MEGADGQLHRYGEWKVLESQLRSQHNCGYFGGERCGFVEDVASSLVNSFKMTGCNNARQ